MTGQAPPPSASPSPSAGGWLPLAGVRVADFSLLLPGPFATCILADLGADVVKIEPPAGDFARDMPSQMFRMANRNKRSIVVDLKHEQAGRVVERLARWADVAFEGYRPGVAHRLGIGEETLRRLNPALICCSLSGYGQEGPARLAPGHDLNYLAAAGALSLPGHWQDPPRRSGLPLADLAGGAYAAIAVLAALNERRRTGKGVYLDMSVAEATLSFAAIRHGLDQSAPTRQHLYPTNDLFETQDGQIIALGIVEPPFWKAFLAAVADQAPDLADSQYADESGRRRHGDALIVRMREVLRTQPAAYWLPRFQEHDVPAQRVLTLAEASRTPQMAARQAVWECAGERHVPFPVRADGIRGGRLDRVAPSTGQDTEGVLKDIGFDDAEIRQLCASDLVRRKGDGA